MDGASACTACVPGKRSDKTGTEATAETVCEDCVAGECLCVCVSTYVCLREYVYVCVYMCLGTYVCMYVCVCMSLCVFACVCE